MSVEFSKTSESEHACHRVIMDNLKSSGRNHIKQDDWIKIYQLAIQHKAYTDDGVIVIRIPELQRQVFYDVLSDYANNPNNISKFEPPLHKNGDGKKQCRMQAKLNAQVDHNSVKKGYRIKHKHYVVRLDDEVDDYNYFVNMVDTEKTRKNPTFTFADFQIKLNENTVPDDVSFLQKLKEARPDGIKYSYCNDFDSGEMMNSMELHYHPLNKLLRSNVFTRNPKYNDPPAQIKLRGHQVFNTTNKRLHVVSDHCMSSKKAIEGIDIPSIYFGTPWSCFPSHCDDWNQAVLNLCVAGQIKKWWIVKPCDKQKLEAAVDLKFGRRGQFFGLNCNHILDHMFLGMLPQFLDQNQIQYIEVDQNPGDIVLVREMANHTGYNTGYNINIAVTSQTKQFDQFEALSPKNLRECDCREKHTTVPFDPLRFKKTGPKKK